MSGSMRFGVTLPQIKRTWAEAREAAVEFDELGYDHLWVCDHLYGVPRPDVPILEAWSELAAVAAITRRAQLGTLVTPPLFRNAAVLAKQIATIDNISDGRVIAGLGAGWFADEFEGYGIDFPSTRDRLDALAETVELMIRMWTEPTVTYEGEWVRARDVHCEPKPVRRPPVLIGGSGETHLMGVAARFADIWNNTAVTQSQLGDKIAALHRRCEQLDRDPATIEVSQQCTVVIAETMAEAEEAVDKAVAVFGEHMGTEIRQSGIWGDPDRVIELVEAHRDLGASHLMIEFFGRDTRAPARLFAEAVIPAFAT
jgi:probable F420-dependent oxidoreductase